MKIEQVIKEVEKLGYKFIEMVDNTLLFKSFRGIELELWLDEKIIKKINRHYEEIDLSYKEISIERKLQNIEFE